ncbi:MAG: response regulator transcription factor [Acidobacteriia bacterium]|nr:response regulator transcription factor [Terriglobia bacterium]
MRVLITEDDKKVASFICKGLEQECYAVDVAHDGAEGAAMAGESDYDILILDLALPKMSGLQVLRKVRQAKCCLPVLVLTCRDAVEDMVAALDAGADDYLVKPFVFAELAARVRALLRRRDRSMTAYRIADLTLDVAHRTVSRAGHKIDLSSKEFALLEYLLRHARRTVTRTSIIEHVWDIHFDSVSNVVDVYVKYLRDKIDKGFSPPLIRTIRGVGYMLTDEDDAVA